VHVLNKPKLVVAVVGAGVVTAFVLATIHCKAVLREAAFHSVTCLTYVELRTAAVRYVSHLVALVDCYGATLCGGPAMHLLVYTTRRARAYCVTLCVSLCVLLGRASY
jgi:hypothetical protein